MEPADLGFKLDAYEELTKHYRFLKSTKFDGLKTHNFKKYVADPRFKGILKEYHLSK